MKKLKPYMRTFILLLFFPCMMQAQKTGTLSIQFINTASGKKLIKGDTLYTNPLGEKYSITKLKYYISKPALKGKQEARDDGYYLIDEGRRNNFEIKLEPGIYERMDFLLGIDSIRHCSGAQDGDLDPLMDMFWTWNSGYVIFKLEGYSSDSPADLGRIEHHIGGYKGKNNVSTPVILELPSPLVIRAGEKHEIQIEMNLDKYWNSSIPLSLRDNAVITRPGEEAVRAGQNFKNIFSVLSLK